MRSSLIIILVLLVMPVVSAIPEYVVVIGQDSPSLDVVTGANFAASMKGSVGVTFTSAIDQELYPSLSMDTMDNQFFVVIDAKTVKLVGGVRGDVRDAAELYFTRQGFSVTHIASGYTPDDVLLYAVPALPEPQDASTPTEEESLDVVVPDAEIPAGETQSLDERVETLDDTNGSTENSTTPLPSQQQDIDVPKDASPGLFKRIWRWFSGLFG